MKSGNHHTHVYTTLGQLLTDVCGEIGSEGYENRVRFWTIRWNKHIDKHGNVPMIRKCAICSGKEHKVDIKLGKFKVSTRKDQDELKNILNTELCVLCGADQESEAT